LTSMISPGPHISVPRYPLCGKTWLKKAVVR
jgi:hypothetical protein